MKQLLQNPIMVNIEINLVEDIIRIIGSAIHGQFSHDNIESVKQALLAKRQAALDAEQKKVE